MSRSGGRSGNRGGRRSVRHTRTQTRTQTRSPNRTRLDDNRTRCARGSRRLRAARRCCRDRRDRCRCDRCRVVRTQRRDSLAHEEHANQRVGVRLRSGATAVDLGGQGLEAADAGCRAWGAVAEVRVCAAADLRIVGCFAGGGEVGDALELGEACGEGGGGEKDEEEEGENGRGRRAHCLILERWVRGVIRKGLSEVFWLQRCRFVYA